jgi:hypothetical protein
MQFAKPEREKVKGKKSVVHSPKGESEAGSPNEGRYTHVTLKRKININYKV